MKTQPFVICSLVIFTVASFAFAQISQDKEREIRKLLQATGVAKAVTGMKGQMIEQYRTILPHVPKAFWDDFEEELDVDELITLMLPVYDKHLSLEDIKAVNAFYETPAGKRLTEKTPIMTAEGFAIGRKWGESKGKLVEQRLKDKGLDK